MEHTFWQLFFNASEVEMFNRTVLPEIAVQSAWSSL